ncbi:MAG: GGIII-like transmembrane region-containing protein, partial [Candidatus Binataceae bacterium]
MSPRRIAKLLGASGALALIILLIVTVSVVRRRDAGQKLAKATVGLAPGSL